MPERQAALVIRKLALALEAAHSKGIVHRDLKPGNILYDRDRKEMVITDFGLARRLRTDEAQLTQSGVLLGTPAYMAAEQARADSKAVGPRSDIYSLGVILYELLTGQRPFNGSVAEVIGQVLHVEPDPPSKHRPDLDPVLESICLKAMAKKAEQRYGSMKEFAETLNGYLKGTAPVEPKSATASAATASRRTATREVADLVKELSREHREETAAAVDEAARKARVPFWAWLAGSGLMGVLVLLGILLLGRSGPATIIIQVPLPPGVDLKDTSLAFFLDDKAIAAEELGKPIPIKAGDHALVIRRGEQIIQRMEFSVGLKGKEVAVEVKQVTGPPPATGLYDEFVRVLDGNGSTLPTDLRIQGEYLGEIPGRGKTGCQVIARVRPISRLWSCRAVCPGGAGMARTKSCSTAHLPARRRHSSRPPERSGTWTRPRRSSPPRPCFPPRARRITPRPLPPSPCTVGQRTAGRSC